MNADALRGTGEGSDTTRPTVGDAMCECYAVGTRGVTVPYVIEFCPLHAQAGALREALKNYLGDWPDGMCPKCGSKYSHPVDTESRSCVDHFAREARALLAATSPTVGQADGDAHADSPQGAA